MGTNTGIGIGIGIPFKNNALGGDRPYLPPELKARLIGVWDNYGKKNTDADRNIIKNKIPNAGGDLEILNSAYRLNSGFGGYSNDFQEYTYHENVVIKTDTNAVFNAGGQLLIPYPSLTKDVPSFKIKVSGLSNTYHFRYYYRDNNGVQHSVNMAKDGNYELPICYNVQNSSDGTDCGFANNGSDIITVEILPAFEGALVTDGINDIIASIKTLEEWNIGDKGITIVSMIHQINTNTNNFITTNNIRTDNKVVGRNIVSNIEKTGIYGWYKKNIQSDTINVINNILGDKNDYTSHSSPSTNINSINNSKFYVQGYAIENGFAELSSVAHYWTFAVLGKATEDEINLIIGNYNLDRTLNPDILCNTIKQGITNENHAEFGDKLIDFSGNGRDIQLNNLAWDGDSGIGKYNYPNWKVTATIANTYSTIVNYPTVNGTYSINVNGVSELMQSIGLHLEIKYTTSTGIIYNDIKQDGVYSYILPDGATDLTLRFGGIPGIVNEPCNITITQIPSHAGALCLDGVNDFGKVTGMPVYKDYTVVTDREIFANIGAILSKNNPGAFVETAGSSVYSFGQATSGLKVISTRSISYLSKYSYCGQSITAGAAEDGTDMWLGTIRDNDSRFFNGAIYSLMSFPYSMSEFLIERQLKKHKLGTLYPDMVEFRPVIKSNVLLDAKPTFVIRGTSTYLNAGDYVPENSQIWVSIKMNNIADRITKFTVNGKTIDIPKNAYSEVTLQYGFPFVIDKSPQKISITIEQDEKYVLFNPIIKSNVEYHKLDFYLNNFEKRINIGDYIPKDVYLRANFYLKNNVDELTVFTFNGVNIGYRRSIVDDTAFNIGHIYNYDSPQEVNITIDEYIRYEDIKQPYPLLFEFTDENGNLISWGGKAKVGSTITRTKSVSNANILAGLYNTNNYKLNGKPLEENSYVVEKQMVFTCTATWDFDNNEPKCILSPRLLRIPNSSYKILGYIPDISGHGNHGKINNSAYAEGSGVNEDGSYQFDGVNDFVTIPTLSSGGKQVLMKVNWSTEVAKGCLYDQRKNIDVYEFAIFNLNTNNARVSVPAYQARNDGKTYIDGILNNNILAGDLKQVLHNITITNELVQNADTVSPTIGNTVGSAYYTNMALYDFMLFDEISTDEEILNLNKYIGIEPKVELPPYYWDAYGKTNLDADKATIQQRGVAVGDYDLTNYNHAYNKMSGYGGYKFAKFDNTIEWFAEDSSMVVNRNGYLITLKKVPNVAFWRFRNTTLKSLDNPLTFKVKCNKPIDVIFQVKFAKNNDVSIGYNYNIKEVTLVPNESTTIIVPSVSVSDIPEATSILFINVLFNNTSLSDNEEYTVEMLPLYPNGLVYDAITDYSENVNIPVFTDFTAIMKRKWLKNQGCPLIKGSKVYEGGNGNALLFEWDKAYNFVFYKRTDIMEGEVPENISFITPTNYNGNVITRGSGQDTNGICIAGDGNAGFANMIFYKLILYPKTIPLLQINFLKNLMERDEIIDLTNPIFIKDE